MTELLVIIGHSEVAILCPDGKIYDGDILSIKSEFDYRFGYSMWRTEHMVDPISCTNIKLQ